MGLKRTDEFRNNVARIALTNDEQGLGPDDVGCLDIALTPDQHN
ncbi:MAG: hypothetical protein WAO67_14750 [Yoonia sp.]|jgi:hypothetical protein